MKELRDATVAIVGLGLLGGSLGRALVGACDRRIGVVAPGDADAARTAAAFEVVDHITTLDLAVPAADIVVLAAPVREIIRMLPDVAALARPGTLVTDVGSSKAEIVAEMELAGDAHPHVAFVGGHPMAGGTTPGVGASDPELFSGARWAVCPTRHGGATSAGHLERLILAVGADPVLVEPEEHDAAVALVSHLPRVVASSLVELLASRTDDAPLAEVLAGRGWHGATRLADGDAEMWDDVLATNRGEVARAIRELASILGRVADDLDVGP